MKGRGVADRFNILITNDDGIRAPGLKAVAESLSAIGKVTVVAPEIEQSASSHSITLNRPLRINDYGEGMFSVTGSPADCVIMAVYRIMKDKPDVVVSGINHGPNMGEDVIYSGTVGAAIEGYILGIDSLAVSVTSWNPKSFDGAASITAYLVSELVARKTEKKILLNINIPPVPEPDLKGIEITKLGSRVYNDLIVEKIDPRGGSYYWIGGADPGWKDEEKTDFHAVKSGFASVTPLSISMTDYSMIVELEGWNLKYGEKRS